MYVTGVAVLIEIVDYPADARIAQSEQRWHIGQFCLVITEGWQRTVRADEGFEYVGLGVVDRYAHLVDGAITAAQLTMQKFEFVR